ncbi:MAG: DNA cytosine methyltransferase [Acidobacteriia bacterium]|nr:DNA cytosine methyltransferase [Terriglobia bacterium]
MARAKRLWHLVVAIRNESESAETLGTQGRALYESTAIVGPLVPTAFSVRRLTPREYERLQGLPDDYTLVPYRGRPAADSPRYRAIGSSVAVPVTSWIGSRIQMVDSIRG